MLACLPVDVLRPTRPLCALDMAGMMLVDSIRRITSRLHRSVAPGGTSVTMKNSIGVHEYQGGREAGREEARGGMKGGSEKGRKRENATVQVCVCVSELNTHVQQKERPCRPCCMIGLDVHVAVLSSSALSSESSNLGQHQSLPSWPGATSQPVQI